MRKTLVGALVAALLLPVACKSSHAPSGITGVLAAWQKAGLQVTAFEAASPKKLGATTCRAGKVSGLDVTLCRFSDEKAARQARNAGLALVGNTTGASLPAGPLLLIVSDPKKSDPSGRQLNRVAQVFQKGS